jgi:hypothetical protein
MARQVELVDESAVHYALKMIVMERNSAGKVPLSLNWAINYAKVGIGQTGSDLELQIPYVIGNITHWRGELATSVRNTLKQFVKQRKSK